MGGTQGRYGEGILARVHTVQTWTTPSVGGMVPVVFSQWLLGILGDCPFLVQLRDERRSRSSRNFCTFAQAEALILGPGMRQFSL